MRAAPMRAAPKTALGALRRARARGSVRYARQHQILDRTAAIR